MRSLWVLGVTLAVSASAYAAPNVANTSQKGSLLVWPDIRVDGNWNTLIRLQNDGDEDVIVKCYWMDGNKNRVDVEFVLTKFQPFWFDARTGNGTKQVNQFPSGPANGFDNPHLAGPWAGGFVSPAVTNESNDTAGAYQKGLLVCWVVAFFSGTGNNPTGEYQVKWNHLSGTATVYHPTDGIYEYNVYAFFNASTVANLQPVGDQGTIEFEGDAGYDQCPEYQIGQFTPVNAPAPSALPIQRLRLAVASCTLHLQQDAFPVFAELILDVWNEEEVKFTGAHECSDSWHESEFEDTLTATNGGPIDSAAQSFLYSTLGTYAARYRLQGAEGKSPVCPQSQAIGVLAVQSMWGGNGPGADLLGSTLASAGKVPGEITWDAEANPPPEGGIR